MLMRMQSLGLRHQFDSPSYFFDSLGRYFLKGHAFHKTVQIYPAVLFGIAICRQGVVSPRGIVSGTLGRIISDKDRSCIPDVVHIEILIGSTDYKMLR